jgi:hypothetical protein
VPELDVEKMEELVNCDADELTGTGTIAAGRLQNLLRAMIANKNLRDEQCLQDFLSLKVPTSTLEVGVSSAYAETEVRSNFL